jgi:hypothetical protein
MLFDANQIKSTNQISQEPVLQNASTDAIKCRQNVSGVSQRRTETLCGVETHRSQQMHPITPMARMTTIPEDQ